MIAKRKLTIEDVVAMAEIGLIAPDERVELIEGELYTVTPPSSRHAAKVDKLMKILERAYGDRAIVRVQSPIALSEHSAPEPDLTLLKPREDFYESSLPKPGDVLLVVEVSWSSLGYDHGTKLPLYARAGILEVWIVNLEEGKLEVYRRPQGNSYHQRLLFNTGEAARPLAFEEPDIVVL
jgi:Uma2 family endonuclease